MDFFNGGGFFDDDPFSSSRGVRMRREDERRVLLMKTADETVLRRALARIVSKNEEGGKQSLEELKDRLLNSTKSDRELSERVTSLLHMGLAVLLNSLETFESFFQIRNDLGRIVRLVYPRGYPRRIHSLSKRTFNTIVRELQQLYHEHGPIDVDARGNYVKATIREEADEQTTEEEDEEQSDHQEQQQEEESTNDDNIKSKMQRTFSVASESALKKLATFREQLDGIKTKVDGINSRLSTQSDGNTQDKHLGKFKSELGLLNGRVDKLQFSGIDSVMVGPLTSGKGDARALRKQLNKQASELSKLIKELHKRIGKDLFYRSISHEDS